MAMSESQPLWGLCSSSEDAILAAAASDGCQMTWSLVLLHIFAHVTVVLNQVKEEYLLLMITREGKLGRVS